MRICSACIGPLLFVLPGFSQPPATLVGPPTVTPKGEAGSKQYGYVVVPRAGSFTATASAIGDTKTGGELGVSTAYNTISWSAVDGAKSYDVYRVIGGTSQGRIATTTQTTLDDTGLNGDGSDPSTKASCSPAKTNDAKEITNAAVDCVGWILEPNANQIKLSIYVPQSAGGNRNEAFLPLIGGTGTLANELFSLIAEIAVDKAKREGLALVHDKLADLVCRLEFKVPSLDTKYHLELTCKLVRATDLSALVGQGKALRSALTGDLLTIADNEVSRQFASIPPLAQGALAGISLVRRVASDPDAHLSRNDVWLMTDAVLNATWGNAPPPKEKLKALQFAIACARSYVQALQWAAKGQIQEPIDLAYTIARTAEVSCQARSLCPGSDLNNGQLSKEWTALAVKAVTTMSTDEKSEDFRGRLRSALQLVFDSYDVIANDSQTPSALGKTFPSWVRVVAFAALDADAPHLISALAETAKDAVDRSCTGDCPDQRKVAALLTGISTYAISYVEIPPNTTADQLSELQKQQHDTRKQALESVIDAATNRRGRGGEYVVSAGVGVGFSYNANLKISGPTPNKQPFGAAQLHLPLGIAVQKLPGRRYVGFHAMATVVDLGNYVRAANTNTTRVEWQSIFAPGVQAGIAIGKPNAFFVFGGGAYHSPRFATTTLNGTATTNRATQVGVFAEYYFSLWDFN
jgi:hypothetical protein